MSTKIDSRKKRRDGTKYKKQSAKEILKNNYMTVFKKGVKNNNKNEWKWVKEKNKNREKWNTKKSLWPPKKEKRKNENK